MQQSQRSKDLDISQNDTAWIHQMAKQLEKEQAGISQPIEELLIKQRKSLNDKILRKAMALSHSKWKHRYILLGLALSLSRREDYDTRWNTFYDVMIEALKMNLEDQQETKIHQIVFQAFNLLALGDQQFLVYFPETAPYIKSYYSTIDYLKKEQTRLGVRNTLRLFNSFLSFRLLQAQRIFQLFKTMIKGVKDPNQFLEGAEVKLITRLRSFHGALSCSQIQFLQEQYLPQRIEKEQNEIKLTVLTSSASISQFQPRKKGKLTAKFLLKQFLLNKQLQNRIQGIKTNLNHVDQNDIKIFQMLVQAEGEQNDQKVSQYLWTCIRRLSHNYLTVSRIKALMRRIKKSQLIEADINFKKIQRVFELLGFISEKFNQTVPILEFKKDATFKIQKLRNVMTLILSVDLHGSQTAKVLTFCIKGFEYSISLSSNRSDQIIEILDITIREGSNVIVKEKKSIVEGHFIMCLVSLQPTKAGFILKVNIDGALFDIGKSKGDSISKVTVGPLIGTVKDIFFIQKSFQLTELHKRYLENHRKMDEVLQQLGHTKFVFTLQKNKKVIPRWWSFWKQQEVSLKNCEKIYSISFSQAVQQLGGLSSLLYLLSQTITEQEPIGLCDTLSEFFKFIQKVGTSGSFKIASRWMLHSTGYLSEFLWILVSYNEHVGKQAALFDQLFDLLDWFSKKMSDAIMLNFGIKLIQDIYSNFQIWPKCSVKVQSSMLAQLHSLLQSSSICVHLIKTNFYQDFMSNFIFFIAKQEQPQIYRSIVESVEKVCLLYSDPAIDFKQSYLKRDLNTVITILSSLFNTVPQENNYTDNQIQIFLIIENHFRRTFLIPNVIEKCPDIWIYVVYQIGIMLANCSKQLVVLSQLLELGFIIINEVKFIQKSTIFIDEALFKRRANDSLQFSFQIVTRFLARTSIKIQSINLDYSIELREIITNLLTSLCDKAQRGDYGRINAKQFCASLTLLEKQKLLLLISNDLFNEIVEKYIEKKQQIQVVNFLLHKILSQNWFPKCSNIFETCIDILCKVMQSGQITTESEQKIDDCYQLKSLALLFQNCNLRYCLKNCRSNQLIDLLIKLHCFESQGKDWAFKIPIGKQAWRENQKQYGGQLGIVITWSSLTLQELDILTHSLHQIIPQRINQQMSFHEDILHQIFPFFILSKSFSHLVQNNFKSGSSQLMQVLREAMKYVSLRNVLVLWEGIKKHKAQINYFAKTSSLDKEEQLYKITEELKNFCISHQTQVQPNQIQITKWLQLILKEETKSHEKEMKQMYERIDAIVKDFADFITAFWKSQKQSPSAVSSPTKKKSSVRKQAEISDFEFYAYYSQCLKEKIKTIYSYAKNTAKKRQKEWAALSQKNRFWTSTSIRDNQVYEIDPKITGPYRLNIIKNKFEKIKYPRRQSFKFSDSNTDKLKMGQLTVDSCLQSLFSSKQIKQISQVMGSSKIKESSIREGIPQFEAEYVTQKGVYPGKLYYIQSQRIFKFICYGYESLPKDRIYQQSTLYHRIQDTKIRLSIQLNSSSEIYSRRYILRHTAIEIFSFHKSHFFNLFKKQAVQRFFKTIGSKITCVTDLRGQFKKRKYTEKWIEGQLDNFQYLMLLNKFSGRTYNDLGQYPVMPWVITNYGPEQALVDSSFLKNEENMRDLTKPSGKLSEKKFRSLKERCEQIDQADFEYKFLYGTMYSNPTTLYNFFIRLEPFISLHWEHQGQRIDHADRLFSSIKEQFATVLTSSSDNKQLCPQFYYWPEFLKNRNQVNLGVKQNKQEVHAVKLPGWACCPEEFVFKMREALQCSYVTQKLNNWIDLVFGYKNPRDVAYQHDNLFHFRTYEHDIFQTQQDEMGIRSAQICISEFGQVPYPLFMEPHPEKHGRNGIKIDESIKYKVPSNNNIIRFAIDQNCLIVFYPKQLLVLNNNVKGFLGKKTTTLPVISPLQNPHFYNLSNQVWVDLNEGRLSLYSRKGQVFSAYIETEVYTIFREYIVYGFGSELVLSYISPDYTEFQKISSFYGHKNTICLIESSKLLDIIVSVDEDGLVLVHEFESRKMLREFDLDDNSDILQLCIHQMGYFIFFTRSQRLVIYTYLGELFLDQDIEITKGNTKDTIQKVTAIQILSQNSSNILLGTDHGRVYQIDFLDIKRFNSCQGFKTYSRIHRNIIEKCEPVNSAIKQMKISKVSGETGFTYRLYILHENNILTCCYEQAIVVKRIKENRNFSLLGIIGKK